MLNLPVIELPASSISDLNIINAASNALGLYALVPLTCMSSFNFNPQPTTPNPAPQYSQPAASQWRQAQYQTPTCSPIQPSPDDLYLPQLHLYPQPDPYLPQPTPRPGNSPPPRPVTPSTGDDTMPRLCPTPEPPGTMPSGPSGISMLVDAVANDFGFGVTGDGNTYREYLHVFALVSTHCLFSLYSLPVSRWELALVGLIF
jgi:hypothetical protein